MTKAAAKKTADEKLAEKVADEALEVAKIAIADDDVGIEQRYKERYRWSEQCFLARVFPEINELYSSKYKKSSKYVTSFSTMDGGEATTADFYNKLHKTDGDSEFVNISTYERSHLLWSLKLSKVLYEEQGARVYKFKKEIPLIFEKMAAKDMEDYKSGNTNMKFHHNKAVQYKQGYMGRPQTGYGVKSFEWRYVGSNPGTVRNDIEATMVVEFQNFDQLSKIHEFEGENYSLLDLLGYGPNSPKSLVPSRKHEYESALYELKAVVQWGAFGRPKTGLVPTDEKSKTLKDKIKGQKTTLFLTMIDHDFNVSQLGTFTLTLTYRARLESLTSQMGADVAYAPDTQIAQELRLLDLLVEEENKLCPPGSDLESLQNERERASRQHRKDSNENMLQIELRGDSFAAAAKYPSRKGQDTAGTFSGESRPSSNKEWRIYETFVDNKTLGQFINGTVAPDAAKLITEIKPIKIDDFDDSPALGDPDFGQRDYLDRKLNLSSDDDGQNRSLRFMFFGDILDVMAARGLYYSDTGIFGKIDEKIKIISGPVRLKIRGQDEIRCSISDIPVSLEVFSDFWFRNVIEPDRQTYSLIEFIRDFGEQVINKSFGEDCAPGMSAGISGNTRMKMGFFSLPQHEGRNNVGEDPLLHLSDNAYNPVTGDILVETMPTLTNPEAMTKSVPDKVYDYVVLYLQNTNKMEWSGKETDDAKKGIYHLKIHQGILQSIDFSKTDQPYLREARFRRLNKNPLVHLSNVYNIRASMVGNTCFYPGDTVYINPIGFGTSLGSPMAQSSLSSVMGLGGYHTIISVSNRISRDFTTEIVAQWTSNGSGEAGSDYSNEDCQKVEDPD